MHQRHMRGEVCFLEVLVVGHHLLGGQLTLVGHRLRRQGAHIHGAHHARVQGQVPLGHLPDTEQLSIEVPRTESTRVLDEDLLDPGLSRLGSGPEVRVIYPLLPSWQILKSESPV